MTIFKDLLEENKKHYGKSLKDFSIAANTERINCITEEMLNSIERLKFQDLPEERQCVEIQRDVTCRILEIFFGGLNENKEPQLTYLNVEFLWDEELNKDIEGELDNPCLCTLTKSNGILFLENTGWEETYELDYKFL